MEIPKAVLAIRKCAAKEPGRYAINGVHFARCNGRPIAVATNGRILLLASWKDSTTAISQRNFECIVAIPQLDKVEKVLKGKSYPRANMDECPNGTVNISAYGTDVVDRSIVGVFPKWRQVIPRLRACLEVTLEVELLCELAESMKAITGKSAITLRIPQRRRHSRFTCPLLVVPADSVPQEPTGHKAVGAIMPISIITPKFGGR